MSRGIWAMMTLLEVFDCSFSDSLVHKFSAPEITHQEVEVRQRAQRCTSCIPLIPTSENTALLSRCWQSITLLIFDSPHHEVHACSVGLATKLERALFPSQPRRVMKHPLQLRLAAAKLFQYKVVHFPYEGRLQSLETSQEYENVAKHKIQQIKNCVIYDIINFNIW